MATAKKSQPLTLEELLSAQRDMLKDPNLTEGQRKSAEQQIEKLESIQKTLTLGNIESLKEDADINRITKVKGDAQHVSLGDVRDEMRGLRKDLTAQGAQPATQRRPLPQLSVITGGGQSATVSQQPDRESSLRNIGSIIEQKTEYARGGSRNEGLNIRNAQTFDRFIAESGKKEELLADADEKQLEIFQRIEDTLIKLREAGSSESESLRKELAGIAGELEQTGNTKAKEKLSPMLSNIRSTASAGISSRSGNLGDVVGALTGKREVLKEGFTRDERTGRVHRLNPETGKVGNMVKAENARMGRLAGAGTILKGFAADKIERFYEGQRSPGLQNFLDRNFRSENLGEKVENLEGQQRQAMSNGTPRAQPKFQVIPGGKTTGMAQGAAQPLKAAIINITGDVVNINGGKNNAFSGSGTIPGVKDEPKTEAKAEAADSGSGFGLGDVLDIGKKGMSKAGSMAGGAWTAGKGLLSRGAGLLTKIPGGALKGGAAALGGAALSYGGEKLKEAGYEKTGAAADIAGQAAQWGGTGAMIGSVVPGIGTAIGAGVGAVAGGAYGMYKNWGSFFGGDKKSEAAQSGSVGAAGPQKSVEDLAMEQAKKYGRTEPNQFDKQAAQMMFKGQMAKAAGGEVTLQGGVPVPSASPAVSTSPAVPAVAVSSGAAAGAQTTQLGPDAMTAFRRQNQAKWDAAVERKNRLQELSAKNSDAKSAASAPVVINAPSTNVSNGGGNNNTAPQQRANIRPMESAMEKYANRTSHFW